MRRRKKPILALVLTAATLITACSSPKGETPMTTPESTAPSTSASTAPTTTPPTTTSEPVAAPYADGSEITLTNKRDAIRLAVRGSELIITALGPKQGENRIAEESVFALPQTVTVNGVATEPEWSFVGVARMRAAAMIGMPSTEIADYQFKDEALGLSLLVSCRAYLDHAGPFEFQTVLTNKNDTDVRIDPADFASVTLIPGNTAELVMIKKEGGMAEGYTHHDGQHFRGSGIYRTPVTDQTDEAAWVSTSQNFNSSGYLPMIYVDMTTHGAYAALEWSAGRVTARSTDSGLRLAVDMDNIVSRGRKFTTIVPAGESFTFPNVYIGAYEGDLESGSNEFKAWFFACKAPKTLRASETEPQTQMDMQLGLDVPAGIEAIKWDYGWWSNDALEGWKSLEGSWQLRNTDYLGVLGGYGLGTMAEFGELAAEKGLSWTVYLLLHDTLGADGNPTDEFGPFNSLTNPDWFSNRRVADGMGLSADLGNAECVEYLKGALAAFFTENNVTTWRSDFEPICMSSSRENRHDPMGSDVMYWCTVGFSELVDHLYATVPGFRYESCSSGGSMKDLFTATKAVVINCDDAANYLSMRTTFYDSSYVIHPAQLQLPCNSDNFNPSANGIFHPKISADAADDGYDFTDAMMDMGYRTMMLGVPMFSSWTGTIDRAYYEEYGTMYTQKIRPLVRDGELYHILPRPDGVHWDGVMYADPDSENAIKGAVFLFKPSEEAGDSVTVQLRGLERNTTYHLTFEDHPEANYSATGAELMDVGVTATVKYVGSEIIWITE